MKSNCPTCGKANVPKGMHCRSCVCDILTGAPIGTADEVTRITRNKRQRERRRRA